MIEAVVFDLDGVLLDTEELWDEARRELAQERGAHWPHDAQRAMMGMSSPVPVRSRKRSISGRFDEDAMPRGQRAPMRPTASSAPGMSGSRSR